MCVFWFIKCVTAIGIFIQFYLVIFKTFHKDLLFQNKDLNKYLYLTDRYKHKNIRVSVSQGPTWKTFETTVYGFLCVVEVH